MQSATLDSDRSLAVVPGLALPSCAFPWLPDQGDGTYRNPIIHADYSDPDVIRVGDDFYLVASSMNCTPGLPILHSRDLVNWTLINHAVKHVPHPRYERVQPGCGIWAPAIQFHAGRFWIFFCTPDEGIYLTTADDPAGQWTEPHLVQAGKGLIDPSPLWDEDGKAYLVHAYASSRAGIKHRLRVCPMATDGSKLHGEGQIVYHDPEKHPTLEGPKFLKRNGWYYISAPAGGVPTGWQVILRSRNIFGPYEDKIVLAQGNTEINGPHQGALVDTPDGKWWFIHFQDAGLYGRIIHLQPVRWENDWPLIGVNQDEKGVGQPVLRHRQPLLVAGQKPFAPQTSDEFDSPKLGLQWQWHANHRDHWYSLAARPGWLRLFPQLAVISPELQPNMLLQKFPARSFVVEAAMEFSPMQASEEAGLVVAGELVYRLGIHGDGVCRRIVLRAGQDQLATADSSSGEPIRMRVAVSDGGDCVFSYAEGGTFKSIGPVLETRKGNWIGAKVGLYSIKQEPGETAGHVDVDYFQFS